MTGSWRKSGTVPRPARRGPICPHCGEGTKSVWVSRNRPRGSGAVYSRVINWSYCEKCNTMLRWVVAEEVA